MTTCYLCHQPLEPTDSTAYWLAPDGSIVEVHAACWKRIEESDQ